MYQIIQTQPNEYVVIDRREPHPFSGYKVVYRIRRATASHEENGASWVMVNFSIEKPGPSWIAPYPSWGIYTTCPPPPRGRDPVVGKTSWKDVRATLAELLQVTESDIIE
jgi:hypothetical protein